MSNKSKRPKKAASKRMIAKRKAKSLSFPRYTDDNFKFVGLKKVVNEKP